MSENPLGRKTWLLQRTYNDYANHCMSSWLIRSSLVNMFFTYSGLLFLLIHTCVPPQYLRWCNFSSGKLQSRLDSYSGIQQSTCFTSLSVTHLFLLIELKCLFLCVTILNWFFAYSMALVMFNHFILMWPFHNFCAHDRVIWGGWREGPWLDRSRMQHLHFLSVPWINRSIQTLLWRQNLGTTLLW